jgi:hypothetical protein
MVRSINDDGTPMVVPIVHYPIYSGWLSNDPWTLHFTTKTDSGRKSSVDIPCEVIAAGRDTFAKYLGARGFFCTEPQYKSLKEFFVAWLQKLQNAKDSVISAAPFGWSVVDGKVDISKEVVVFQVCLADTLHFSAVKLQVFIEYREI